MMSAPCLALCVCAFLVSWSLKLRYYLPTSYECWKDQQTPVCQSAVSKESKEMSMEDLFSGFLLDFHVQLLTRHRGGEGRKWPLQCNEWPWGAEILYGHQAEWLQHSKGRARHWGAFYPQPSWLWGEEAGRGDFTAAVFPSNSLPLPACDPTHMLLGHPSHFAEICDSKFHVDDKSNT